MTRVLWLLGVVVAAIAIVTLVVHGFEDRGTLVPPPDAVAEEFVRQLVAGRSDRAMPLLSEDLRTRVTPQTLEDYGTELEAELGEVGNVSGEAEWIQGDRAAASALLDGARRTKRLRFVLVREHGTWTIGELDELEDEGGRAALAI